MQPDLRPPGLQPPGNPSDTGTSSNRGTSLQRIVWMLFGFVVALTLVVLVILPYWVDDRQAGPAGPGETTSPASVPPLAAGVARHDAEQALQAFLRLRAQPDLANVEQWAVDDWQQAMDTAATGDDHYGEGDFAAARAAYDEASRLLTVLQQSREQLFADALARGDEALAQDAALPAMEAYQQALAIQPDSETARNGLAQASVRDDVLRAMQDGDQARDQGNWRGAAQAYTSALQLDPAYVPAQQAKQSVDRQLAQLDFRNAMSQALMSLDAGDLAAADNALSVAAGIFPDHPAVHDARLRLAGERRQVELARLRREAAGRAAQEDWAGAARAYRQALKFDSNAVFATTGLAHAEQRMKLHAQLDHYLSNPARLASDEPLTNARELLEANRHLPEQEPKLARKITALQESVRLASVPVTLNISSDGLTEVAIYHVGRLGRITDHQLSLRPGRYTIIGSRPGYRDVRKVVTLNPETPSMSIMIRCEEPI